MSSLMTERPTESGHSRCLRFLDDNVSPLETIDSRCCLVSRFFDVLTITFMKNRAVIAF